MKKVFKYGTGQEIPEGAEYLCTKTQSKVKEIREGSLVTWEGYVDCWLVWHYFLVEVKE